MKTENLKQFLLKKYPAKDYFDCPVPKHHWETIQEYADYFAKLQIEKDRKRITQAYYNENDLYYFNSMLKNTPIILD